MTGIASEHCGCNPKPTSSSMTIKPRVIPKHMRQPVAQKPNSPVTPSASKLFRPRVIEGDEGEKARVPKGQSWTCRLMPKPAGMPSRFATGGATAAQETRPAPAVSYGGVSREARSSRTWRHDDLALFDAGDIRQTTLCNGRTFAVALAGFHAAKNFADFGDGFVRGVKRPRWRRRLFGVDGHLPTPLPKSPTGGACAR